MQPQREYACTENKGYLIISAPEAKQKNRRLGSWVRPGVTPTKSDKLPTSIVLAHNQNITQQELIKAAIYSLCSCLAQAKYFRLARLHQRG